MLFSLFIADRTRAEELVPIRLDYTAPAGCPAADRFLGEIAARTARSRPARPDEPATTLTVSIHDVRGGHGGTLRLESAGGAVSSRKVLAADCEQVVSALALMTALAIDPDASTAPVPPTPLQPKPPKPPSPPPAQAPGAPAAPPARTGVAPRRTPSTRFRLQIGAALEALGGVSTEPIFVVRPSVELGNAGASPFPGALRLSAGLGRKVVTAGDGGGEFTLVAGRLEGCPVRLGVTRTWRFLPCLSLDAGRLQASGMLVSPIERVRRPYISPGVIGRVQWEIVNVLVLEVAGEVLFPLVRDRFFVGTDATVVTVYRTPAIAGGLAAGLGVRFP